MSFDPMPATQAVLARQGDLVPLPVAIAPRTEAEGAAVQRQVAARRGAVPPAGFKIGATTERMRRFLGLPGAAGGFMQAANLHASGAALPFAGFRKPGTECELAVRIGRDLPAGPCTAAQARDAVAEVFPAIEIVENRYGTDLLAVGTPTLIADSMFHAAAILGAPVPGWRDMDLGAVRGAMTIDGVKFDEGHGSELMGDPMAALAWLAASDVAREFGGLRAGQVVMLGSVTPPAWLDRPCAVEVAFEGMGKVALRLS